jgi:hypothetical protein
MNQGIKTSKKLESFTPAKNSSGKFKNENWKGMKSAKDVD